MKKLSALFLLTILLTPSLVNAQVRVDTPTPAQRRNSQELRLTLQERQAEFKEKLKMIKDQRKQTVVQRIDQQMQTINTRRVEHMDQVVDRLSDILDRVASKAALAKETGTATSAADTAIAEARVALKAADEAIASQAAETYVLPIEDETTLKNTVGQTIKQLNQDLKNVYELVRTAREKVVLAARETAKLKMVTPTASQSAQ